MMPESIKVQPPSDFFKEADSVYICIIKGLILLLKPVFIDIPLGNLG